MEIRYPNYYKKFQCIAGACPDTCCAGWEIPVDGKSEQRYKEACRHLKKEKKEFVRKLKKHIKGGRIISEDVTCPFLNNEGLCEMYIELGPEVLCNTCARHPRHMEDYGNLHEMVLLLSCPEVARLVLEENDGGFYVRKLPERQGNIDGIDEELLEILLQVREMLWKLADDQTMEMKYRLMCIVALAHDVQCRLIKNDFAGVKSVLARYDVSDLANRFSRQWKKKMRNGVPDCQRSVNDFVSPYEQLMYDFFEEFAKMDTVCREWPGILENYKEKRGYSNNKRDVIEKQRDRICEPPQKITEDLQKILNYFIYSFVLAALYDGDLLTKVKMSVFCTMAVGELYMTADSFTLDERIKICHAVARQVENSDENRAMLEGFLKQKKFASRRLISDFL